MQKEEAGGNYSLTSQIKIGVLRHFIKLGKLLFPRYFFYALFSLTSYLAYVLLFMKGYTPENLFILFFGGIVTAIFCYEAARVWFMKPF